MLNRVTVTIDGMDYTVVSEDNEAYIRKNAALVDKTIGEIKSASPISTTACAVLAALNIADMYYKSLSNTDNLRSQVKEYSAECDKLRAERQKNK